VFVSSITYLLSSSSFFSKTHHMANRLLFLACFALFVALSYAAAGAPTITNCLGATTPSISTRAEYVCVNVSGPVSGFTNYIFYVNGTTPFQNQVFSTVNGTIFFLGPLNVGTTYSIRAAVNGTGNPSSNTLIITTAGTVNLGPIRNPTEDLQNPTCVGGVNSQTKRTQITCSWTDGSVVPKKVIVSAICKGGASNSTSGGTLGGRKVHNHIIDPIKVINATSTTFAVNRHPATCTVLIRARYAIVSTRTKVGNLRKKGGAQHFNIVKGNPFIRVVNV